VVVDITTNSHAGGDKALTSVPFPPDITDRTSGRFRNQPRDKPMTKKRQQRCDACLRLGKTCHSSAQSQDKCLRCHTNAIPCTWETSKLRNACANCQRCKKKCNRQRPSCSYCLQKKVACLYNGSQQLVEREIAPNEPSISNHQFEQSILPINANNEPNRNCSNISTVGFGYSGTPSQAFSINVTKIYGPIQLDRFSLFRVGKKFAFPTVVSIVTS